MYGIVVPDVHKWSEFPEVNTFINDLGVVPYFFPHHGKRKWGSAQS